MARDFLGGYDKCIEVTFNKIVFVRDGVFTIETLVARDGCGEDDVPLPVYLDMNLRSRRVDFYII